MQDAFFTWKNVVSVKEWRKGWKTAENGWSQSVTSHLPLLEGAIKMHQKTMVNRAKSDKLKAQILREKKDSLMAQAVAYYLDEKSKNLERKPPSLRHVCQIFSDDYYSRTRLRIKLDHNTLSRLAKGGIMKSKSNARKSWLTYEEQEVVLKYVIEMARCGFPLSPHRLHEHAEMILRAHFGDKFLEDGLGVN